VPAKFEALPVLLLKSADWAPLGEALSLAGGALATEMIGAWNAGVMGFMTGFSKWRANRANAT
jgi:hypothetical protein